MCGTVAVAAASRAQNQEMGHSNRSCKHTVRVGVLQTCKHCRETYHNRTVAKKRAFATHIQPTQCSHGWLARRAGRGAYQALTSVYFHIELLRTHTTTQNVCDGWLQQETASQYLPSLPRPRCNASSERPGRRPPIPTTNSEPATHITPFQTRPMIQIDGRMHQPASETSGRLFWAVGRTTGANWGGRGHLRKCIWRSFRRYWRSFCQERNRPKHTQSTHLDVA